MLHIGQVPAGPVWGLKCKLHVSDARTNSMQEGASQLCTACCASTHWAADKLSRTDRGRLAGRWMISELISPLVQTSKSQKVRRERMAGS